MSSDWAWLTTCLARISWLKISSRAVENKGMGGVSMKFALGQAVPRTEDPRLLTGRGRYTDDFVLPRLAHAYVLRSPHAHAHIRSVDIRGAQQIPGVLAV